MVARWRLAGGMRRYLYEAEEVAELIRRGEERCLVIAGDEIPLRRLPKGRWIAGTIPYFMSEEGGVTDRRRLFVEQLPATLQYQRVCRYSAHDIARVYADLPPHGIGLVIVPSASPVHLAFAVNAPRYEQFAANPLFGWVSGVHLSEIGKVTPKVFDGTTGAVLEREAVVIHATLPPGKVAELAIINIFEKGNGPAITFPATDFSATTASVDGHPRNFAEYIREVGLDTRLPLVADYWGANVNVGFQSVDAERGEVRFYAPVFAGVVYHHARPIPDYVKAFTSAFPSGIEDRIAFSCNCVLNYMYSSLEGRHLGTVVGPVTFGEIAYQLLNQTMVYLTISDAD
jgi:hypothetical protein